MFWEFLSKWESLQHFRLKHIMTRTLNFLFPFMLSVLFLSTMNLFTSTLMLLGLMYFYLNFKIRYSKESLHDSRVLLFREKKVFSMALGLSLAFVFVKLGILGMKLDFFSRLIELENTEALLEIMKFVQKATVFMFPDSQYELEDLGLSMFFCALLLSLCLLNRNFKPTYDYFTSKVLFTVFAPWLWYLSLVWVCLMQICRFLRAFQISLSIIIELAICIYILFRIFLAHHLRNPVNLTRHMNLLKYFCLAKILIFIFGINMVFFTRMSFDLLNLHHYLSDLNDEVPNEALIYSFSSYIGCCVFAWTSKFRDHLSYLSPRPKRKFLSHQPYRKMFYKVFAPNLPGILGIQDRQLGRHLTFSLDLKFGFYRELSALKWFVKIFRNSIRKRVLEQQMNLGLFFKINSITWKYFGVFKLYKYSILQYLASFLMVFFLSINSYSLDVLSVFNVSGAIVLMLFDSYQIIFWATLLLIFVPHILVSQVYIIALYIRTVTIQLPDVQNWLWKMIDQLGLSSDKENLRFNLMIHVTYAIIAVVYLIAYRCLHNRAKRRKIKNQLQHIRLYKMRVYAMDEDGLFLLSKLLLFLLSFIKYYLIYKYLAEALQFVSISNGLILISLYFYLCLNPRGLNMVCAVVLSIFLLRFFSRYSTFFGFLENHFNLLYGFYFNFKDSFFSEIVMDLRESHFHVYLYNFYRVYLLVTIKKLLHRFYDKEEGSPKEKKRRLVFKTQVLATIYNTATELFSHCQNIINTTKIFFVYFSIYYFAYEFSNNQVLAAVEICYCSFLLLFHLLLFQKKRHTANKAFAFFFGVYYLLIVSLFASSYVSRLSIYGHSSYLSSEDVDFQEIFEENYQIMMPLCVKLILGTISLGALYQDFKDVKSGKQMNKSHRCRF